MAINKAQLAEAITGAFQNEMPEPTEAQQAAFVRVADAIADGVAVAIKQGVDTAVLTPALVSPSGPVTGTIAITTTIL